MCNLLEETMDYFMSYLAYGKTTCEISWKYIFYNYPNEQKQNAIETKQRQCIRKSKLDKAGLPSNTLASML